MPARRTPRTGNLPRRLLDHAEMVAWLALSFAWVDRVPVAHTLRAAQRAARLADRLPEAPLDTGTPERAACVLRGIQPLFGQRARCLHRAFAAQAWLARRGVPADVVIGARPGDRELDAHAWLEIPRPGEPPLVLLPGTGDGWTELLRSPSA